MWEPLPSASEPVWGIIHGPRRGEKGKVPPLGPSYEGGTTGWGYSFGGGLDAPLRCLPPDNARPSPRSKRNVIRVQSVLSEGAPRPTPLETPSPLGSRESGARWKSFEEASKTSSDASPLNRLRGPSPRSKRIVIRAHSLLSDRGSAAPRETSSVRRRSRQPRTLEMVSRLTRSDSAAGRPPGVVTHGETLVMRRRAEVHGVDSIWPTYARELRDHLALQPPSTTIVCPVT